MSTLLRWDQLVARINGTTTVGMLGVRDPDYPCEAFRPRDDGARVSESDLSYSNRCETDGHYMCVECTEISIAALREREDRCVECGGQLVFRAWERICPTLCPSCEPGDATQEGGPP